MKGLYIRFFNDKLNGIPTDSHIIVGEEVEAELQTKLVACYSDEVVNWMIAHPNGKVDFVWL